MWNYCAGCGPTGTSFPVRLCELNWQALKYLAGPHLLCCPLNIFSFEVPPHNSLNF